VSCSYGSVWRVQDSLAVSRAFGDILLKKWVISEPDIRKVQLTVDCDFLVMASDGLWNKVHFFNLFPSFFLESLRYTDADILNLLSLVN
jgi:serine/threonine protein phosphatase PrpC